jgi:hypothetical protein
MKMFWNPTALNDEPPPELRYAEVYYYGYRGPSPGPGALGVCHVVRRAYQSDDDGQPLDPRLDLWNHSPTGFEWGYGGSGPCQLALALLADALGDGQEQLAVALRQTFKSRFVAGLPRDAHWCCRKSDVLRWVADQGREG